MTRRRRDTGAPRARLPRDAVGTVGVADAAGRRRVCADDAPIGVKWRLAMRCGCGSIAQDRSEIIQHWASIPFAYGIDGMTHYSYSPQKGNQNGQRSSAAARPVDDERDQLSYLFCRRGVVCVQHRKHYSSHVFREYFRTAEQPSTGHEIAPCGNAGNAARRLQQHGRIPQQHEGVFRPFGRYQCSRIAPCRPQIRVGERPIFLIRTAIRYLLHQPTKQMPSLTQALGAARAEVVI